MKRRLVGAVLALLFVLAVSAAASAADPKYTKSSTFGPKMTDGVTDEFLQMVRRAPDIAKGKPLRLDGAISDDDLKKIASLADALTAVSYTHLTLTTHYPGEVSVVALYFNKKIIYNT